MIHRIHTLRCRNRLFRLTFCCYASSFEALPKLETFKMTLNILRASKNILFCGNYVGSDCASWAVLAFSFIRIFAFARSLNCRVMDDVSFAMFISMYSSLRRFRSSHIFNPLEFSLILNETRGKGIKGIHPFCLWNNIEIEFGYFQNTVTLDWLIQFECCLSV